MTVFFYNTDSSQTKKFEMFSTFSHSGHVSCHLKLYRLNTVIKKLDFFRIASRFLVNYTGERGEGPRVRPSEENSTASNI